MQFDWTQILQYSFQTIWGELMMFLPQLVLAILVLIVGWIIGGILKTIVGRIFRTMQVDSMLDKAGVDTVVEKAGYQLNSGLFMGTLIMWFVVIVFFVAALDILGLNDVTFFLRDIVLGFLPQVIVAVLILFGGIIVGNFAEHAVEAGARAAEFKSPDFLGAFARYAVVTFAVLAALNQISVAPELIQMLFAGLVFALSLALGLAFGLGGRDTARKYLEKMTGGDQSGSL